MVWIQWKREDKWTEESKGTGYNEIEVLNVTAGQRNWL